MFEGGGWEGIIRRKWEVMSKVGFKVKVGFKGEGKGKRNIILGSGKRFGGEKILGLL